MTSKVLVALAISLSSFNLCAADRAFDEAKALRVLDEFVAEFKVYATCIGLTPEALALTNDIRKWEFERAKQQMSEIKPTKLFLARFLIAEASPLLDDRMTMGEARKLCAQNSKAPERLQTFGYTVLSTALLSAR
jgi:hypothetical protein